LQTKQSQRDTKNKNKFSLFKTKIKKKKKWKNFKNHPTNYTRQGGGAALPRKPTNHTITQPRKPSYTKTPTKETPTTGNHNQYSELPSNPPYTAIYQY
jgi:hypothetical protein